MARTKKKGQRGRGGGRGGVRGGRGGGASAGTEDNRTDLIEKVDMQNERFSAYYKAQNIVPEEEWETFLDALRQHLPTTFRVAGSRQTANTLNATIKDVHVPSLSGVVFEGLEIPPPVQIPWYPDGLAWQFNVPKKVLRKSPEFKRFHSFLVFETEVGNVSRQEAVSMLPPLFLDVEPHHKVMDMCAAPGSKTAQLLEALHSQDTVTSTSSPTGLLIANDSDHKRTHLLIHQSARLPSPALIVTNLDASNYPVIKVPSARKGLEQLLFDRILCDVPCSGDGTMRKNMGIWKHWQPMDGNGLHSLQVRILQRAMKLLKDDGRIVYSTCSLNPIENEAVIATALKSNPEFYLVDVSNKLPKLQRRPGLTTWRPAVDRFVTDTFETYEAYLAASEERKSNSKITEGHWPPSDVEELNLPRCLRIYPHLQDSGGFFVAVLEKKNKFVEEVNALKERKRHADEAEDVPETKKARVDNVQVSEPEFEGISANGSFVEAKEDTAMTTALEVSPATPEPQQGERKETGSFKEDPYTFVASDDQILRGCMERLNLTSEFPSANVLVRNPAGQAVRSLYLANDLVKAIVQHNDYNRIRLTSAGTKVFMKQEAGKGIEAQFRVLGEGLPVILPYINPETIIIGNLTILKTLVESYYPLCSTFDGPFRSIIEGRPSGSHIVRFSPENMGDAVLIHDIVLPIWKSNVSVTLMIDKKAKSALSLRLFGVDITTAGREAAEQKKTSDPTSGFGTPLVGAPLADATDVGDVGIVG